jgi:DNA-binding transcriptional ArsR family regulator
MNDLEVIEDPASAEASLDPVRSKLLAELASPASAASLAGRVGLARQKVNYHLKALERHGLIELVEARRKGSVTERVMQATAASYVISPTALATLAPDPDRSPDRLSALWLVALAGRVVGEVGELINRARGARQSLPTFGVDAEIRFASAADRAEFAAELSAALEELVARYHDEQAAGGRRHRLILALHPTITKARKGPHTPNEEAKS